jgi:hypothetical protein
MKKSIETSRQRFRTLAPVEFDPKDFLPAGSSLQENHRLLDAVDVADDLFWRQTSPNASVRRLLELAGEDQELREMVLFHCGPYDRLDNDSPFLPVDPKPPGAGFYPPDLSREEFTAYLESHPDCKSSFMSPYTLIRRTDGPHLTTVPYHHAYRELAGSLSRLLAEASREESHSGFREFLAQRAQDLLTDDYYVSDSLWVRLVDNPLDLVIGPCEVYEDRLMGLKAAYEAMLLGRDFEESSKVQHFQRELPSLCQGLEREVGKRLNIEKNGVALSVANLIYAGGDARKAIPAIAFCLPNDERIIEEVGCRQVMLRNVLEAKFRLVNWPLQKRLLPEPLNDEESAFRCFFDHTLFHEISHSIGPHRITKNGEPTTVNRSLKQHYSVLEEAKADTLAACLVLQSSHDSDARAFVETYVSGFLRAIRFGLSSAHGGANSIQFNFLLQEGAIAIHPDSGRLLIDPQKVRKSLIGLVSAIIGIQELGDFEAADRFLSTFCVASAEITQLAGRVSDLPIDIRIRFKGVHDRPPIERSVDRSLVS